MLAVQYIIVMMIQEKLEDERYKKYEDKAEILPWRLIKAKYASEHDVPLACLDMACVCYCFCCCSSCVLCLLLFLLLF